MHVHRGAALTLIDKHIQVGEESTMSDDVRGNLLGADESDWQDEETGLEVDEYFDEDDLDPTQDDLAVIDSMGWGSRTH